MLTHAGEAAALEMLEGRHPLALAHYANHPAPGTKPNTIIASFTFTPAGCRSPDSITTGSSRGLQAPPYLRAYVPNITYQFQCNHRDLLEQVHTTSLLSYFQFMNAVISDDRLNQAGWQRWLRLFYPACSTRTVFLAAVL